MNAERLLAHYERIADAPDAIERLRRFILELAMHGKLVEQDPNDEPAVELLKKIAAEKERLVKVGEIKKQSALPLVATYEALLSVPNVWEWTRIGSAAYVEMGQSPPSEHYNRTGHGIPFFQGKADFGKRYPTARYWCTQPKKYAAPGDILISVRAPVGPTNVASEPCCIGRGLAALRSHNGIDRYYLLRCLEAFEHALAALGFGTTFVAINKNQLIAFVIPLPPLAEQHRIVAKVDELMALCDRLEAARTERESTRDRLAAVSLIRLNDPDPDPVVFRNHAAFALENFAPLTTRTDQIKALRRTILSLAVRGKLVEQDPNDEPAAELLRRLRANTDGKARRKARDSEDINADEVPFECPEGWMWTKVQQTLNPDREISYGVIKLGDEPKFGGIPTLRCSDVRAGFIDLLGVRKVDEAIESEYARTRLLGGDVVINIRGTLGGVALVPHALKGFNVAREVAVVPIANEISGPFVVYLMLSPYFWDHIQNNLRGIAYKGLNLGILRELPIPLPPLAEQHRIVAKVDELMALCDRLDVILATDDDTRLRLLDALLHEALPARRLRGVLHETEKSNAKSQPNGRS